MDWRAFNREGTVRSQNNGSARTVRDNSYIRPESSFEIASKASFHRTERLSVRGLLASGSLI